MQVLSLWAGLSKEEVNYGGWGGFVSNFLSAHWFCCLFRGAGGGKCPEEEHTTCSGGPTINCHKRGLRGERIFLFYKDKIKI
jgi:hypothetical protein